MTKPEDTTAAKPAPNPAPRRAREPEDGRTTYAVTKLAGLKVAGQRVAHLSPKGKIRLTEDEARAELVAGTIVPEGSDLHEMFSRTTPKAG